MYSLFDRLCDIDVFCESGNIHLNLPIKQLNEKFRKLTKEPVTLGTGSCLCLLYALRVGSVNALRSGVATQRRARYARGLVQKPTVTVVSVRRARESQRQVGSVGLRQHWSSNACSDISSRVSRKYLARRVILMVSDADVCLELLNLLTKFSKTSRSSLPVTPQKRPGLSITCKSVWVIVLWSPSCWALSCVVAHNA